MSLWCVQLKLSVLCSLTSSLMTALTASSDMGTHPVLTLINQQLKNEKNKKQNLLLQFSDAQFHSRFTFHMINDVHPFISFTTIRRG